jgi:hypothetical protein
MKMSPKDGWVAAPDRTWVLAGGTSDPVLIYSLSGPDIILAAALPGHGYKALWFDPHSGATRDEQLNAAAVPTVISKPDEKDWLLLLMPNGR